MNNIVFIIEIVIVAIIITLQFYFFSKTVIKLNKLKEIIPEKNFFKSDEYLIPIEILESESPEKIIKNISQYDSSKESNEEVIIQENED